MGQVAAITPFLPYQVHAKSNRPSLSYNYESEEEFWRRIRVDYALKPDYINLENGYYNIAPVPTIQKFTKHIENVNYEGSYYMRTVQWDNKKRIANRLAKLVGCASDELIITRNTTESLDMIIGGYPWKEGDEAIYAVQDYGAMREHFKLVAKSL